MSSSKSVFDGEVSPFNPENPLMDLFFFENKMRTASKNILIILICSNMIT